MGSDVERKGEEGKLRSRERNAMEERRGCCNL